MHCKTLDEWLAWLEQLNPDKIEMGLERVRDVATRAGLLSLRYPVVTVGGTNGKGSVCAILENVFTQAGYRVGMYSSPHLFNYNERIRVGTENATDAELCRAFETIENNRHHTRLTYFEFGTLAAVEVFRRREVDIAILEVGLGGRLDAVNLWDAELSIISSLALDHSDWLGETLDDVAYEKSAIARAGRPLLVGEPKPPQKLFDRVEEIGAKLFLRGRDYDTQLATEPYWHFSAGATHYRNLPAPGILGSARYANAATALQAIDLLARDFPVTEAQLNLGLMAAKLPGRAHHVEIEGIDCVFDVAHNPQAISAFVDYLSGCGSAAKTVAVVAFMADKAIPQMLGLLADTFDHWYTGDLPSPRAMKGSCLADLLARQIKATTFSEPTICKAFRRALDEADPDDRIVVFGSFVTVAQTLRIHL